MTENNPLKFKSALCIVVSFKIQSNGNKDEAKYLLSVSQLRRLNELILCRFYTGNVHLSALTLLYTPCVLNASYRF